MANPEGSGFWGFLKRLFAREGERKTAKKSHAKKETRSVVPGEEKKEKKDNKALAVIDELKRVGPSHPAYEILGNVNLSPDTLKDHDDLSDLILDIIHTINKDPNQYHNPKWLQDKVQRLSVFKNTLGVSSEAQKINDLEKNVEALYIRSQKDRREAEVQEELGKLRQGELPPENANPDSGRRNPYKVPEGDWQTIISTLPDEAYPDDPEQKSIKQKLIDAYKRTLDQKEGRDQMLAEQAFADAWVNATRDASKRIKPGDEKSMQNYLTIRKAFEAASSDFLKKNPREGGRFMGEMRKHGSEYVENRIKNDPDYRDYWFYRILENVLYNHKIDSHRELYQLYESGEMHDFLEIVRRIKTDDGRRTGLQLADRYDVLKNTIFQSHDMDYYCAHPQQDMKEFIGSTSLFLNEYIDAATQDPMVALAKRAYEAALFHIRESNGGYVPREWLAWQEGKVRSSKLDEMVENYLKQAIASGQLYSIKEDKITGLPAPSVWNRKQIDPTKPYTMEEIYGGESVFSEGIGRELGDLKIAAALKQAKGLALVDQRLLEIIGKSKGTGTRYVLNNNKWDVSGFNSVPYEGIVRYIDPVIHYYGRFGVGMDISNAFFNMIVSDRPDWDPMHMKHLLMLYNDSKFDEAEKYAKENNLGDIQTRLNAVDNPFGYSGMWGTMTKWRVGDATAGFDDWEKDQAYAAAVKLTNIGDTFSAPERKSAFQKWGSTWAYLKAKQYFTEVINPEYAKSREDFRNYLLNSGEIRYVQMAEQNGDDFESEWRTVGIRKYRSKLDEALKPYLDEHKKPKEGNALDKLTKQLERAYKARVWVQTATKAPLIIARQLETSFSKHGEAAATGPLRKKIIWELLGIDLDDLELRGGQENLTPTAIQEAQFDRISDIEGALYSLQQTAIRENRGLTDADFQKAIDAVSNKVTGDPKLSQNFIYAQQYWHKVKKAMFGNENIDPASIYKRLGIEDADMNLPRGLRFHHINWDTIQKISLENRNSANDFIINDLKTGLLNNKLIDRNWRHLFSTEDMGWEFLNTAALGSRNPVRRAGDLGSHVEFGQLFEQYLVNFVQRPNPKMDEMVEHLDKMFAAMSGDFQDVAADACGRVAYSTGKIFKKADWAWKIPFSIGQIVAMGKDASIAQMIHGRDRATAWGPNDMLQWTQAVGSHILPKARYSRLSGEETMPNSEWDRALLGKRLGGTKLNALYEVLNMAVFIAVLITIYRAITAKSEEEED